MENDNFFELFDNNPLPFFDEALIPQSFTPLPDFVQNSSIIPKSDIEKSLIEEESLKKIESLPTNFFKQNSIEVQVPFKTLEKPDVNNQKYLTQKILNIALREAIEKNLPNLVENLIHIGADPNCTYDNFYKPLFLCAAHDNLDCFEKLYKNGAKLEETIPSGQTVLHAAIYAQNLIMFKKLIELAPFHFNFLSTQQLLPKFTLNPLYMAIFYEATEILNFVFTQHSPHLIKTIISECFPLHYAIMCAKPKSIKILLNYTPVDHRSKSDETPLMWLARRFVPSNNPNLEARLDKIADLLISHGANLQAVSKTGYTACQIATMQKKDALVKKLSQINTNPVIFSIYPQPTPFSANQFSFVPSKKTMSLK